MPVNLLLQPARHSAAAHSTGTASPLGVNEYRMLYSHFYPTNNLSDELGTKLKVLHMHQFDSFKINFIPNLERIGP